MKKTKRLKIDRIILVLLVLYLLFYLFKGILTSNIEIYISIRIVIE